MVGTPLTSADPTAIGPYTLVSRLGEGGMGVVYLASDSAGKRVALKVIRPHLASADQFLERFRSEVALARKVARFCTAPILDSDTDSDPPYIVSEYVDGPTLTTAVAENGPLSGSELHALGVGVANALTAIHRVGIVHRDLKPSNVLLSRYGPRVIDFGIAKAIDALTSITQTGQFVGSPSYTAPERYKGESITPATDIFAWGSVLAFAGTGRQPFGTVAEAVAYRVLHGEPDLDGLDPQLADIVIWTLSKDPADRPSAQELLDTLLHQERGGKPRTPPARPAAQPARAPEPPTQLLSAGATVTAPLPTARRRPGRLLASALAVVLLFGGAAAGGWYTWGYLKARNAAKAAPAAPRKSPPPPSPPPTGATPAVRKDDKAVGPAPPVKDAVTGGTVTAIGEKPWKTLDPQRVYDERAMSVGSSLLYRTLTGYVDDGAGHLRLVGDLATTTGTSTDDGFAWEYELRPGITFQDGTPITAADIAYGVGRSFADRISGGPRYIQNWLTDTPTMSGDFRAKWAGPYATGEDTPPNIKLLSPTRLKFVFPRKHPEFPLVAALATTAPVPKRSDTREDYGDHVVASGPYKIHSVSASRVELERNPKWNPASDPIRHAYPDKWVFRFNTDPATATDRVLAGTGDYHAAFSWSNIPTEKLEAVKKTAGGQILAQATPTTHFLAINTQHVTELNVRKALNAAIDRVTALAKFRGANHGNPSLTILSSAMPGYRPHNGLGVGVQGDKKQARSLLNGQTPHLKLAYDSSNSADKRLVTFLQSEFQAVGFTIELAPIGSSAEYWAAIGRKDNPYDLYLDQWGSDIPDGSGVFNHLFDSGTITDADNKNISYLRDQVIDLEILRLQLLIDRDEAAKGYGKLDETILHDDAPIAPLFEQQQLSVFGKDLGGLRVHRVFGTIDVADTYVKH